MSMSPKALAALFGAALLAAGCAGGPTTTRGTWSQVWSGDAALTFAVREVCLASVASGRPAADFALSPSAMPVSGRRAPSMPGTAWYVGSGTYIVEQPDGRGCHVTTGRGDAAAMRALVVGLLGQPPHGFVQGRSGIAGAGRMLRTSYCADGPRPMMALLSTARPDSGTTPAVQLSIIDRDPSSARNCVSNGAGDGSDRDYDD